MSDDMASNIVTQLANEVRNKQNLKDKGRRQTQSDDNEPRGQKQYSRSIGPQRETLREKASRYGQSALDFRDDLYGYRHPSRDERFKKERSGKRLSRNTGSRASSPVGNVNFFPPVLSMQLPGSGPAPRASRSSGRSKRSREPVETHSAYESWYIPPSLQNLF